MAICKIKVVRVPTKMDSGSPRLNTVAGEARATFRKNDLDDLVPNAEDLDLALTLLLRTERATIAVPTSSMGSRMKNHRWALLAAASGVVTVLAIGGFISQNIPSSSSAECNSNYEPCIPIAADLSCSEIRIVVQVIGEDSYGLDRDGDGFGCEIYK